MEDPRYIKRDTESSKVGLTKIFDPFGSGKKRGEVTSSFSIASLINQVFTPIFDSRDFIKNKKKLDKLFTHLEYGAQAYGRHGS